MHMSIIRFMSIIDAYLYMIWNFFYSIQYISYAYHILYDTDNCTCNHDKKMLSMWGQNGQIPSFCKIFCNIPLFVKYLTIYHLFETQVCETWVCCVAQVS